jgi:hypothetical protein
LGRERRKRLEFALQLGMPGEDSIKKTAGSGFF